MSDIDQSAVLWLDAFAGALGLDPPTTHEIDVLLKLAGTAAHASTRQAAPVACWLAARSGLEPTQALTLAAALTEFERQDPAG